MGVDPEVTPVRGLDDGPVVLEGEARVGLDHIHPGVGEFLRRPRRSFGARDLDLVVRREDAHPAREPRPAHPESRPGDLARVHAVTNVQAAAERPSEVHRRRDAGHEQLSGRDGHDLVDRLFPAALLHPREPLTVVTMAQDDQMSVKVDEPGQHCPAAGVDNLVVGRDLDLRRRPHPDDPFSFDEHGRVMEGRDFIAVEEHSAHEGELVRLRRRGERGENGKQHAGHSDRKPSGALTHFRSPLVAVTECRFHPTGCPAAAAAGRAAAATMSPIGSRVRTGSEFRPGTAGRRGLASGPGTMPS